MKLNRVIFIVIDGFGIGALPDAYEYGDENCNTFRSILTSGENFYNLGKLGLYAAAGIVCNKDKIIGSYGKLTEKSNGKDTLIGHWELCGIITETKFPLYPNGFPNNLIEKLETEFNRKLIGNIAASGTEIIQALGDIHCQTGNIILYTSADSVLQLAAHEKIVPLEQLYKYCAIARKIMQGEHRVGRVIARPFIGENGMYTRTKNRKDFCIDPPYNLLDILSENNIAVHAIGKIDYIFNYRGIQTSVHTKGNTDGINQLYEHIQKYNSGIIFINLIDTDMLYGHRNDIDGYAKALKEIDSAIGNIMPMLKKDDLLIVTADHGCDPGYEGTDHTREYTPILSYFGGQNRSVNLSIRKTFSDVAATILSGFNIEKQLNGKSFWEAISDGM